MRVGAKEEYDRRKTDKQTTKEKKITESWRYKLKDPITLFTGVLALVAILQLRAIFSTDTATHELAKSAEKSAEAALDQIKLMQADQRPWVTLRYFIDGDLKSDGSGAMFNIGFAVEALGKTPARQVEIAANIIGNKAGLIEEQERLCDAKPGAFPLITMTLFPGENLPHKQRFLLRPDDIQNMYRATLVACAHYVDGLTNERHVTPIIARLGVKIDPSNPETGINDIFMVDQGSIAKDRLGMKPIAIGRPAT